MTKSDKVNRLIGELQKTYGDSVNLQVVGEIVDRLAQSRSGPPDTITVNQSVLKDLEELSRYIQEAKAEIAALRPDEVTDQYLPTAANELDAIVAATAEATHAIMDATEMIENVVAEVGGNAGHRLEEATTRIYEACGFQDITGQRISKIVRALKEIEIRVGALVKAFGDDIEIVKKPEPAVSSGPPTDGDLLQGPQMPTEAASQADIDRLLAELDAH